jgi:hypothetical protein
MSPRLGPHPRAPVLAAGVESGALVRAAVRDP